LLFSYYLLRKRGFHVLYLGQHQPVADIQATVNSYHPHYICTALNVVPEQEHVQRYINQLVQMAPDVTIFISGYLVQNPSLFFPPPLFKFLRCLTLSSYLIKPSRFKFPG